VPRWAVGILVGIIGLLLFFSVASGMRNSPFAAAPTPDDGTCPLGWVLGMKIDQSGNLVPNGSCQRLP
jgi:hypothetical protein